MTRRYGMPRGGLSRGGHPRPGLPWPDHDALAAASRLQQSPQGIEHDLLRRGDLARVDDDGGRVVVGGQ